jgi:hypothetical protein
MPKQLTKEEFIKHAVTIHGHKYDYTKTKYTNAHGKVIITCPVHGDFTLKATSHTIQKQGCARCAGNVPYTTKEYIDKCNIIHNNYYDYTKTIYSTAHNDVTITCPKHGDFDQKAYVHLQGHRCPDCGKDVTSKKAAERGNMWSYSDWEKAAASSEFFNDFTVYIVECWNESERFLKIGKTFTSIHRRFVKGSIPYEWKVLHTITGSANYISRLENILHKRYKKLSYNPLSKFHGNNECYSLQLKDHIDFIKRRTTGNT